jgi:hypothetical protein
MIAPAIGGMTATLVMVSAPAMRHVLAPAPRVAPAIALAVAVLAFVAASVLPTFDRRYPRPETVLFAVDGDAGRSFWMTPDPAAPPWAAATFAGATRGDAPLPFPLADVLAAPAPATTERGPEITWLADAARRDGHARVRVAPPDGAEVLAVRVEGVRSARVDGVPLPSKDDVVAFRFFAPPRAGVEIDLANASAAPVVVRAASQHGGLPAGFSPGVRPAESIPKPGMLPPWEVLLESDTTVVAVSSSH